MYKEKFLGIEIGGTKLQIVCGYADGTLLSTHRFAVNREEGAIGIRNKIETVLAEFTSDQITAVGVGFGGPVNRLTGRIETSFHIEGWSGFAIKDWLASLINVPVFIDNDANVAALGEATHGAGNGFQNVLYVTLGSGVGSGLVLNGKIYHGALPGELEIGHLQMDRSGTTLQDLCSGWAVDEKIRVAIAGDPEGVLAKLAGGKKNSEAILLPEALQAADPIACRIFEQTTDDLAFGFSHAIHLLHPHVLVLGGGLSSWGEALLQSIAQKLPRYVMKAFTQGPPIKLTALKETAVPIGCLVLSAQTIQNS
ncbi:MAG: ROK family protein [Chitinophagaceae bacterium]